MAAYGVVPVNLVAVVVAAVASMVLGFLWFGPLFGKPWMKRMGFTQKDVDRQKRKGMATTYFMGFIGALVTSYVLAHFVFYTGSVDAVSGAVTGFWIWLGFVATVLLGMVLWEGKPLALYFLNAGYYLVNLAVMGAILAAWA